ncbi:MAG TPA: hypothetical protein VLA94_02430, partial [Syntrophales bacterium]|nr:hypothetical protein [Syntrophales bacterium]
AASLSTIPNRRFGGKKRGAGPAPLIAAIRQEGCRSQCIYERTVWKRENRGIARRSSQESQ